MPSPVAHSLIGFIVCYSSNNNRKINLKIAGTYALVANLPDFDFIPGFLLNMPNDFHRGASHSIGMSIFFGLLIALIALFRSKPKNFVHIFFLYGGLYLSHVILDLFSVDTSLPYGEQIFWPITHIFYISPFSLFLDIQRNISSNTEFIYTLFNLHNFKAILLEASIFLPVIGSIYLYKKYVAAKSNNLQSNNEMCL